MTVGLQVQDDGCLEMGAGDSATIFIAAESAPYGEVPPAADWKAVKAA